jgi:nucleotide-binding universal stress UspA family protein
MIKDIVVNLNVGAKANSASDYAISVAAALDAHLTGIVFLYGPIVPVSRAGYVPPELEVIERHNQAVVEAARESFTAASTRAGIKAEPLTLSAGLVSEGIDFIVMGGYGHSRLREFVLGGVTRSILRTMTVPVLMSH